MSNNTALMTVSCPKVINSRGDRGGSAKAAMSSALDNARKAVEEISAREEMREPLLREALGETLRDVRSRNGQTLRELSENAAISPGYLSELERGRKEVSSELLASVCAALGVTVSDLMMEAATAMALHSASPEMAVM